MDEALRFNDIHLSLDKREILKGVSLSVSRGEIVTIMGPNGAGKTTLLKIALGLMKPTSGELYIFGKQRLSKTERGLLGYIPQNLGLVNGSSVLSNVIMGALQRMPAWRSMFGLYPATIIDEAYGTMQLLGIEHLSNTKVGKLSGGEKQRVAIARTMLQRPAIVFADEMASNLDLKAAGDVMERFLEIRKEMGLTLIMTHHNPEFAEMHSETVHLMMNGRIVSSIPASSLNRDNLIKMYGLAA
ncbi:MAG: ATP-binding cassette domain-containing protein [Nitrososphaerales archaeon]